jgi:hypothetical protein
MSQIAEERGHGRKFASSGVGHCNDQRLFVSKDGSDGAQCVRRRDFGGDQLIDPNQPRQTPIAISKRVNQQAASTASRRISAGGGQPNKPIIAEVVRISKR